MNLYILDGRTADDDIQIENFKLFRSDRPGYHHGGICVYIRNKVFFKMKTRYYQTLSASGKNKIQLIGNFYRPPYSTNAILSTIEDSIGLALKPIYPIF